MNSYYRSYFLKPAEQLAESDISGISVYFKTSQCVPLNCVKAERYVSGKLDWVIYYDVEFSTALVALHDKEYPGLDYVVFKNRSEVNKILFLCKEKLIEGYLTILLDQSGNELVNQRMDSDFMLLEYSEYLYTREGQLVEEKIFYPNSWTVHTEDYT